MVLPQAIVGLFPRVSTGQGDDPHDSGMMDAVPIQVSLFGQGELEHHVLPGFSMFSFSRMAALSNISAVDLSGQWISTSGSTIGTKSAAMICLANSNCWLTIFFMLARLACLITERILVPKMRLDLAFSRSGASSGMAFIIWTPSFSTSR